MCLEVYQLDLVKFLSAPGLTWQAALRKTQIKLKLLAYINMLFEGEYTRRGICHSINSVQKLIINI